MIYQFQCDSCGELEEFHLAHTELEAARSVAHCVDCDEVARLVVSGGKRPFVRSPFRKGFHEHISADGAYVRDKIEAREIAAENGLVSGYVENLR